MEGVSVKTPADFSQIRYIIRMDINLLPSYYRYNLDGSLQEIVPAPPSRQDIIFADIISGANPASIAPKAPQDLGEFKHVLVDEQYQPAGTTPDNSGVIRVIEHVFRGSTADQAQRYRTFSRMNLMESRKHMEDSLRVLQRLRKPCPYCTEENLCAKVFIRCGSRAQFSQRETMAQQGMPHECIYAPNARGNGVLIVEGDEHVREFCKQSLALFFNLDNERITTTGSAAMAIEELNRSKIEKKRFGLVIVDAGLPRGSGYWLVDELFKRNFDADILMTRDPSVYSPTPKDFSGNVEILPNDRFVNIVLAKPFHSEALVGALKKLRFR
jgi:CheY-like chemotaxis protein